jgi:hypothetical protein
MFAIVQNKAVLVKFAEKFDLRVVGVRYVEGEPQFLFNDNEYYTVKAMEESL